ncbi:hypothetical protein K503DRAFT_558820 [Rhizopogon vinicolor AM-OR11-026]|uniref:DUF202 domain-containing protein n=1 Tax=Rhizopogon vinicolor AM-OR11-026 TaxID=1314800 RepID=A0A1B7N817_9AGAM|nr:hypothetical protein K503DRAFT_558820 [Rhizopogon vinicolor AM-OR11-026]
MTHTYRADSFLPVDVLELSELRARNRTFDGAYRRTALANLGYAVTVLRLFDVRFLRIGLLYLVLSILLFALAFFRARRSRHDFADRSEVSALYRRALPTVGQEDKREYGRPFITAGRDVLAVGALVMTVEILLLVFVLQV